MQPLTYVNSIQMCGNRWLNKVHRRAHYWTELRQRKFAIQIYLVDIQILKDLLIKLRPWVSWQLGRSKRKTFSFSTLYYSIHITLFYRKCDLRGKSKQPLHTKQHFFQKTEPLIIIFLNYWNFIGVVMTIYIHYKYLNNLYVRPAVTGGSQLILHK